MTITKADLERWAAYTGNGTMADLAHVGNLARECLTLTAKLTVAEQRISDLKFALGDGAGWFDRAMAAEQRAADLARRLAVVEGERCERCYEPLRRGSCSGPLECMRWRQTFAALSAAFASLADAVELTMVMRGYADLFPPKGVGPLLWERLVRAIAEDYAAAPHLFAHGTRRGGSER